MAKKSKARHPFGKIFTQALKEKKVSRYRLTKLTGRSEAQLYSIAKGYNAPAIDTIIWIGEAIGMEPPELFRRLYEAMKEDGGC